MSPPSDVSNLSILKNARWVAGFACPKQANLKQQMAVSIFMRSAMEEMVHALPLNTLARRQLYYILVV